MSGGAVTAGQLLLITDLTLDCKLESLELQSGVFVGVRFRLACGGGVLSLVGSALRVIGPGVACFCFPPTLPWGLSGVIWRVMAPLDLAVVRLVLLFPLCNFASTNSFPLNLSNDIFMKC